jgi:hypothetical protein
MLYHDVIRWLLLPGGSNLHVMVQGAVEYLPVSRLKVGERDPAVRSRGLPRSSERGWAAAAVGLPVRFGRVGSLRHTRPGLVPKVVRLSRARRSSTARRPRPGVISWHGTDPACRQSAASKLASRSMACWRMCGDGRISGLGGCKIASWPGPGQSGNAWPRSP